LTIFMDFCSFGWW